MAKRMFIAAFTVDDNDWSPEGPPDQHDIVNWLAAALNGDAEDLIVWDSEAKMRADGLVDIGFLAGTEVAA